MQALSQWPDTARRKIIGVFTDIDDTLTTGGVITSDALAALAQLKAMGLVVIPITGRHIGWCDRFMTQGDAPAWPVDAIVAENGAVAINRQGQRIYQQDAATRARNTQRMEQVAQQVQRALPGVPRSADVGGRETDLAFDYNEHVHLPPETVQQVLSILHAAGMHTSVSSIHIHGCFDNFDKWLGACWIVRELFDRDLTQELDRWVFVGDSGNDQAMFAHFTHSVGVANIRQHEALLQHLPRYITASERGAGFAEVAQAIYASASNSGSKPDDLYSYMA
jgi:HAD superfamily hydrolase (TIGR01484 family)